MKQVSQTLSLPKESTPFWRDDWKIALPTGYLLPVVRHNVGHLKKYLCSLRTTICWNGVYCIVEETESWVGQSSRKVVAFIYGRQMGWQPRSNPWLPNQLPLGRLALGQSITYLYSDCVFMCLKFFISVIELYKVLCISRAFDFNFHRNNFFFLNMYCLLIFY